MAVLRPGDWVYPIMAMHRKGVVLEVYAKKHRTMMVGGPLDNTLYVKVEHPASADRKPEVVEYRARDLVKDV